MVFVLGQSTTSLKQTSKCIWFIEEVLFKEKKKIPPRESRETGWERGAELSKDVISGGV